MVFSAAESQCGYLSVEVFVLYTQFLKDFILRAFYLCCFFIDPSLQLFLKLQYPSFQAFARLPHDKGCLTYLSFLSFQLHGDQLFVDQLSVHEASLLGHFQVVKVAVNSVFELLQGVEQYSQDPICCYPGQINSDIIHLPSYKVFELDLEQLAVAHPAELHFIELEGSDFCFYCRLFFFHMLLIIIPPKISEHKYYISYKHLHPTFLIFLVFNFSIQMLSNNIY